MKRLAIISSFLMLSAVVLFLPIFPCAGCGLVTFENFYTVFFTNTCKCCAPNLEFHDFHCSDGSLKINFRHYHFCERVPVTDVRAKLGITSGNSTIWEVYNSTDIGSWDRVYLESYESTLTSWTMHRWLFEQIKAEKKSIIIKFGPAYTYWSGTPWLNLSEVCG